MTRYLVAAALAGLLASTVSADTHARPTTPRWRGGEGGLTFMADGSHFSPIAFQCERGEVIASVPSPDDPQVDDFIYAGVALRSGKRTGHYRAKVVHGDLDAPFFEFKTTLRDPVIQAFRTTGRISVRDDPELVARTKSERKLIERFFAACRQTSH